jgi:hypothetical protein
MEFARIPLPPKMSDRGRLLADGDRSHERMMVREPPRLMKVMGHQVVSSRYRLVREGGFSCRSGGSVGWLSYGFSRARTSKSRLPARPGDDAEFMKTALAVLALAVMAGCATRLPAARPPLLRTRTAAGAALCGLTPSIPSPLPRGT